MAHGKETPRQKMIGMMYLVLMALLALNVSREVLNAFSVLDNGLVNTIETLANTNNKVMKDFETQFELNKTKVGPWKDRAQEVKDKAQAIIDSIQNKKLEIVRKSEGKDTKAIVGRVIEGDKIEAKDNTDIPAFIMIGDANDKAGKAIHKQIDDFREFLVNQIVTDPNSEAIRESIKTSLNTEVDKEEEGQRSINTESWETEHFEHLPLSGVIAIMSGLQISVSNAEAEALKYLYKQIDAGSFKFNRLEATVIPNSNYIIKGNEYRADVFLAASDTTASPTIYVTDSQHPYDSIIDDNGAVIYKRNPNLKYDSIPVNKSTGKGMLKVNSGVLGMKYWGGIIQLTGPDGSTIVKPFKNSYLVAEGAVTVAPTKMNVFYLGVDNPVDVSVAGIQPDKVTINITNGSYVKTGGGSYIIHPKRPGNSMVMVYANIEGSRRLMDSKEFRVKIVPDPVAKVNDQKGGTISQGLLAAQIGVTAEMENFDFDLKFTVTEFSVSAVLGGFVKDYPSKSNRFTTEQRNLIKSVTKGSNVYIQDIKAVGPDGATRNLSTINFRIN